MTGDTVVWRGLTWLKQAAGRAPPGGLHGTRNQRLVNFHHAAGSARVSKSRLGCHTTVEPDRVSQKQTLSESVSATITSSTLTIVRDL